MITLTKEQKQEFVDRLEIIGVLDAFEYLYGLTSDKNVLKLVEMLEKHGWLDDWSDKQRQDYEKLRDSILKNI